MHKKIIVCEYCGRILIDPDRGERKKGYCYKPFYYDIKPGNSVLLGFFIF